MADSYKVGEAPWEKPNEPESFPVGSAPWETQVDSQGLTEEGRKIAARKTPGSMQAFDEIDEDVINEMHPDIDTTKRAVIKNLSTGDDAAEFNYLQKNYPNLQFKKDSKGNIVAKRREEEQWRHLDPQGFQWSDLLRDILDVAYDIPAGIAQGAATAAGGLGSLPVGGLPGAVAAGAGSGVGLEYLRQALGKAAGLEQDLSHGQAGFAGAVGAASPLLFGSGATAKQILTQGAKQATKEGITGVAKREAIEGLAQSQRGVLSRAFKGGTSALSGFSPKILENAVENPALMSTQRSSPKALGKSLDDLSVGIKTNANEARAELKQAFGDIEKLSKRKAVDISEAQTPFDELIAKRERIFGENPIPENQQALEDALDAKDAIFGEAGKQKTLLPGDVAKNTQDRLNELTRIQRKKGGKLVDKSLQNLVEADKEIVTTARRSAQKVGDSIDNALDEVDLKGLKGEYSQILSDLEQIDKLFGSKKAIQETFKKMEDPVIAQEIKTLAEKYGIDIEQGMLDYYTSKNLGGGSWLPVDEFGKTNLRRAGTGAATGGALGAYLGYQGGGESGYGSGMLGAALVGGLGGLLTGPNATRAMLRPIAASKAGFRQLPETAQKVLAPSRAFNIWQQLQRNER